MRKRAIGDDIELSSPGGVLRFVLWREKRTVRAAALLLMGHQAGEALVPVVVGFVIQNAVAKGSVAGLLGWLGLLVVNFAFLSLSYRFGSRATMRAIERGAHELRLMLVRRVLDDRGIADGAQHSGALLSTATSDARRSAAVSSLVASGAAAVAALVVATVILLRVSILLGLLVVLGTPVLLGISHLLGKPLERRSSAEQAGAAGAAAIATDLVNGIRPLKGLHAERAGLDRYRFASTVSLRANIRAAYANAAYSGSTVALSGAFLALVALVGGRLAAEGRIDIAELIAAVGLTQFLVGPLERVASLGAGRAQVRASAARVAQVIGSSVVATGSDPIPMPVNGTLHLEGVRSGSLVDLDLDVATGEHVGIVTLDAADASALMALFSVEEMATAGSVCLDGVPLANAEPMVVRDCLLAAPHDTHLFDGTLADNVRGASGLADITEVISASGTDELVDRLPEGLGSRIADRGWSLSGGQRQRVALARALVANPPVLVLDDPTSSLDAVTEAIVASRLGPLRRHKTTVILTTSPALLAAMDRVVLLSEGRIVASGTHEELIEAVDVYRSSVLS